MSNHHRMCFGQCRTEPNQSDPDADTETGWLAGVKEGRDLHGA